MLEKTKKIVLANWKMKLNHNQSLALTKKLVNDYKNSKELDIVLCPSFTSMSEVARIIKGSNFKLGAQDAFYHDKGSYTGEVSPAVVAELGCEYVIVGHSERRKLGESDDDVNRKVSAVLKNGMTPVVCVGENFEEYQHGKTDVVIIRQVTKALEDVKVEKGQRLILAYEPVWVIGSGQAVDHSVVEHIVQIIIHTAYDLDPNLADKFSVIYGGSVDAENVRDFIIGNLSTGVIVGGESLKYKGFTDILDAI
jgi:triosephosphate isomerase (TIM)